MSLAMFKERRDEFFKLLPNNSIAILTSANVHMRNGDLEHIYRQDSNFYYLTGFNESHAIAVFLKKENDNKFVLFCQENDPKVERWSGPRVGLQKAKEVYGADYSFSINQLIFKFPELLKNLETIYYCVGQNPSLDKRIFSSLKILAKKKREGITLPETFIDLNKLINQMRVIKTNAELNILKKACDITAKGHVRAMERCKPGMHEYELEAELVYEFMKNGAREVAYPSIVARGSNACILHYTDNSSVMKEGDLVLIDAGAEYKNYAADITRTFPVGKKFTKEQQAIYELVLAAQTAVIDNIKPGIGYDFIHQTAVKTLTQGLIDLEILNGSLADNLEAKTYEKYYMHQTGHWLGLDVHDVGEYKINQKWRTLEPNMVFTVEPGLYFGQDDDSVDEKWRKIAIRIEDDIAVTENGADVLTQFVPKKVDEILQLRSKS